MALDYSVMGEVVQAQMEALEGDHKDDCGCTIGAVVVLVSVRQPDGTTGELRFRTSEGMTLDEAIDMLLHGAAVANLTRSEG